MHNSAQKLQHCSTANFATWPQKSRKLFHQEYQPTDRQTDIISSKHVLKSLTTGTTWCH